MMDAYLICPETKKAMWLGKAITTEVDENVFDVIYYTQGPRIPNHEKKLLNKVLWKFLSEHAHRELRVVFAGEYDDREYDLIDTVDVEAEEYVAGWPPE